MNAMPKREDEEVWDRRELGASAAHVRKASRRREKALDESLGLQSISIRLPKALLEDLKELATEDGLGYQPYLRQMLMREVRNEKARRKKLALLTKAEKKRG